MSSNKEDTAEVERMNKNPSSSTEIATDTNDDSLDKEALMGPAGKTAVATEDTWSFVRDISSRDPNWLLDETDAD